jgi:undecaprenyl diphosphate synthase
MASSHEIYPAPQPLDGIPHAALPRHVAIIMDGNGRWAQRQGLPRIEGHRRGVASVRRTTEECARLGIGQLTLFCLSSENWKRPQHELDFLMHLLEQYMIEERHTLIDENIRLEMIGRREGIPDEVLHEIDKTMAMTRDFKRMTLCLAINYGARAEIADAMRSIAQEVRDGKLDASKITEETIADHLYTSGMPEPDLLIRTAGQLRISNFLLWQISYSELWITDRCWPEFDEPTLHASLRDYATRDRRFGGLSLNL